MGIKEFNFSLPIDEKSIKLDDSTHLKYRFKHDSLKLIVEINKTQCTDNMSGFQFPYTAEIVINIDGDTTSVQGCGKYIGDYRIHDIWALESVKGQEISPGTEHPYLEFNLSGGRVLGNTPCTDFRARIDVSRDSISIGKVRILDESCPQKDLESQFINLLNKGNFTYAFREGFLILRNGETELVFGKMD